jgi:hypothetical protein
MFRHVVMFRWSEGTTDDDVTAMAAALSKLPDAIPELRGYHHGPDARVNEGNWDYVVVADCDSVDDYLVYRDHPAHQRVIADHIAPIRKERAAVQYEVAG